MRWRVNLWLILVQKLRRALLHIYNATWAEYLPRSWKIVHIVFVLKPGKYPKRIDYFKPVCLTSCIGNVQEKMSDHRLQKWLENNKAFPIKCKFSPRSQPHGPCPRSCFLSGAWTSYGGNITVASFLDVQRAFDKVRHVHMLQDLVGLNIRGRPSGWFQAFLRDSEIFVWRVSKWASSINWATAFHGALH